MSDHHRTPEWRRINRELRPVIAAALPLPCVQKGCGRLVYPDEQWDIGHIVDASVARAMGWSDHDINSRDNLGPAHRGQNRSDGGRLGAAKTNAKRNAVKRFPKW